MLNGLYRIFFIFIQLGVAITVGEAKVKDEDDEDDHPQTLIMADAEDHFVLNQV